MAEQQDPLEGNIGGSQKRIEELQQINLEGAKAKATLEGLNSVFKDLGKSSSALSVENQKALQGAITSSSLLSGQIKNFSKNYKENINLSKQLAGATVGVLKDAKSRATFEKQIIKAQSEQASVAADIIALTEQEKELELAVEDATNAALDAKLKQNQAQEDLNNKIAAQASIQKESGDAAKEASNQAFQISNQLYDIGESINASLEKRATLQRQYADLETQASIAIAKGDTDTAANLQKLLTSKQEQINKENESIDIARSKVGILQEEKKEYEELQQYHQKQIDDINAQVAAAENVLNTAKANTVEAEKTAQAIGDQYIATGILRGEQEKAAEAIAKGLTNAQGLQAKIEAVNKAVPPLVEGFKKFADLTSSIPIVGDAIRAVTGDISKAADMFVKAKAAGVSTIGAWRKAVTGFLGLGLFAAAVKFVELVVKGAHKSSKAIVTLNKSVAGSAVDMSAQLSRTSAAAAKFKVPLEEAAATVGGLNEHLGTSLDFTSETTNQAVKLANKYQVSGDAVAHLLKLSAAQHTTMTDMVDSITGGVGQFNALNGVSISTKAVFEDIGSASATTLRNIGHTPGAIIKAAAAARSLGMSMDDINEAARSTLDFQDSMAAEMEAELMLGKELNLDRLRAAAATGDTATQAAEMKRLVMENAGAIGNNVLAQEKFAATLGISREQYNQMLETNDALSVLTGKSGAAEKANAKARKMSQEEIAKSIESTTGKLSTLQDKIDNFQERMALGAKGFADDIIKAYEDEGVIGAVKKFASLAREELKKAFGGGFEGLKEYFKDGSNVGKMFGVLAGGFITFKAGQGLINIGKNIGKLFGFKKSILGESKNTYTADGRLRVEGGGGMDSGSNNDLTSSLANSMFRGNLFKYLGNNGGLTRTVQRTMLKVFGKNPVGKALYNLTGKWGNSKFMQTVFSPVNKTLAKVLPNSATNLVKKFGTNNMAKITKMANTGKDAAGKVISKKVQQQALKTSTKFIKPKFAKEAANLGKETLQVGKQASKTANLGKTGLQVGKQASKTATQTVVKGLTKPATALAKSASMLSKVGKIFTKGNIAAIAGGLIVDKIAGSAKEKADNSLIEASEKQTSSIVGFNANMGDLSDKISLLNESAKSRSVEKAANVGSAALTGAGIGSMVGSIIPGIGTAIGGAVGGVIGAGVGLYQQYFSKEAKENAKLEREARAEMLGITIDQEKLLRKKGVEEAVNVRLQEANQAKEAAAQMLQMDLASFASMTAEEQNRHVQKLNLSDQMMEELNTNIGVASQDLGKIINEEAKKIEDNSFIGKTKKFFSNLFGGGEKENVTKIEQKIDSGPIIKASSADSLKVRNSITKMEGTISDNVKASELRAQAIANKQATQQLNDQKELIREQQNQTALMYQALIKPQKSVIKMDSYKVGESLVARY